jgi:hypothetical protein
MELNIDLKEELKSTLNDYDMFTILINRAKYLYMLNLIFKDELTNEIINEYHKKEKFREINTLDECNTHIKPTTMYLGLVKRLKYIVV